MATKTINTRIKNRVDTLENWGAAGVVLLPGEIALVKVVVGEVTEFLMKTGEADGNGDPIAFASLPWISAPASDVYSWAKTTTVEAVPITVASGTAGSLGNHLYLIKNTADTAASNASNAVAKLEGITGTVPAAITAAIEALDYSTVPTSAGTNTDCVFVTGVTQTNGKIAITRKAIPDATKDDKGVVFLGAKAGAAAAYDDVFGTTKLSGRLTQAETDIDTLQGNVTDIQSAIAGGTHFKGVVTSPTLSDGLTTQTVTINSVAVTAQPGDVALQDNKEFIWTGTSWEELGDLTRVGAVETAIAAMDCTSPSASGTGIAFIATVTQVNGKLSATKQTIPDATAAAKGIVYLGKTGSNGAAKQDDLDLVEADVAALNSNYVRFNSTDNKMYVGSTGADVIIFDCGGAAAL